MTIFSFFLSLFTKGNADKTAANNMAESFTGNEAYWNPTLKAE